MHAFYRQPFPGNPFISLPSRFLIVSPAFNLRPFCFPKPHQKASQAPLCFFNTYIHLCIYICLFNHLSIYTQIPFPFLFFFLSHKYSISNTTTSTTTNGPHVLATAIGLTHCPMKNI